MPIKGALPPEKRYSKGETRVLGLINLWALTILGGPLKNPPWMRENSLNRLHTLYFTHSYTHTLPLSFSLSIYLSLILSLSFISLSFSLSPGMCVYLCKRYKMVTFSYSCWTFQNVNFLWCRQLNSVLVLYSHEACCVFLVSHCCSSL